MSQTKRNALLLLSLAGMLVVILAMSLPNLALAPGQAFALEQPTVEVGGVGMLPGSDLFIWLFRGALAVALILLPVYILYSLMTAEGRKRLFFNVVLIVLIFVIADYLQNHPLSMENQQEQDQTMSSPDNPEGQNYAPDQRFHGGPTALADGSGHSGGVRPRRGRAVRGDPARPAARPKAGCRAGATGGSRAEHHRVDPVGR